MRILFLSLIITFLFPFLGRGDLKEGKQGYSMLVRMNNWGVFGYDAPFYPDSIGIEYPRGTSIEHMFGGGIWVGGLLDTSQSGTSTPITLVTTAYEGWFGPYKEFLPGFSAGDSFWVVEGQGAPKPEGWEEYWGSGLSYRAISDHALHCAYADTGVSSPGHIPLRIRVIQSSFVWNSSDGEGIQILQFRIMNIGTKQIDSAYVGFFTDADVGPTANPNYFQRNCSGYYPNLQTAFSTNPIDTPSTPIGITILDTDLQVPYTFRWWTGSESPGNDLGRYYQLRADKIEADQCPSVSDTRTLLSFGPFTIDPPGSPDPDTIQVAFAIVSGEDPTLLQLHAENARRMYSEIVAGVTEAVMVPAAPRLIQNYPNPFNPSTTIRFSIPRAGEVSLKIFNLLGEEVATLVSEDMDAGTYKIHWDATGQPSGVYFYRLLTNDFVQTRKLVLLR